MSAITQSRIDRLRRLEALLPRATANPVDCPDGGRLLAVLGEVYGPSSESTRRRALQRDLDELVRTERVQVVNPGGKPLRYRRLGEDAHGDELIWEYTLRQVRDLIAEAVPARRLERLWERLLHEFDDPVLDERRLRIVPDALRLRPVELFPQVLEAVIRSLAQYCPLQVLYEDAEGVRGEAVIHPQALIQRGPLPYLFALKNDEDEPLRLYALHRMIRAQALEGQPARAAEDFDLDRAIAQGRADFGQGELIDLEIRVRGYLATLLSACPLTDQQEAEDEPEDSGFSLRVKARLPATGQLLRWLLGAGDNVQVVAPETLRKVVAAQAAKTAALYAER